MGVSQVLHFLLFLYCAFLATNGEVTTSYAPPSRTNSIELKTTVTTRAVENTGSKTNQDARTTSTTCAVPSIATGMVRPIYNINKYYGRFMYEELGEPGQACGRNPQRRMRHSWQWSERKERQEYVKAMQCLHTRPSTHYGNNSRRIDDFVAAHMREGYNVEFTGLHFHWHRIFLHLYEEALRNECGYKGALLYWDFSEFSDDITQDRIFTNGLIVEVDYFGKKFVVDPGSGGGILTDTVGGGLFAGFGEELVYDEDPKKITAYPLPSYANGSLEADFLQYSSRHLTRDLNTQYGKLLSDCHVEYDLACANFSCLQDRMYGDAKDYPYSLSLMNAARFAVGGLQFDPFAGPSDPIWWLVAANFDRLWALWQGQEQDLEPRKLQVAGTHAPYNRPEGGSVSLTDPLEFGDLTGDTKYWVANATSTIEGPLCYLYWGPY